MLALSFGLNYTMHKKHLIILEYFPDSKVILITNEKYE
jgi:hypothetical protein